MRRQVVLFLVIIVLGVTSIQAQWNNYNNGWESKWKKYRFFKWNSNDHPFLELNYGLGKPLNKDITGKFSDIGLIETKLGYTSSDLIHHDMIVDFSDKFFFLSKLSDDLKSEDKNGLEIKTSLIRFGFGERNGYGYSAEGISILPYNQNTFVWSQLDYTSPSYVTLFYLAPDTMDKKILDRYDGAFRFGTASEGGVRIEIANTVSLDAGFEASVIFPRHLFWKQLISFAIESGGQGAVDFFVDEVMDNSPAAGPIVNFVLKNALSYGFYLLKKDSMNWPFETEKPLTYETFKMGVSFTF